MNWTTTKSFKCIWCKVHIQPSDDAKLFPCSHRLCVHCTNENEPDDCPKCTTVPKATDKDELTQKKRDIDKHEKRVPKDYVDQKDKVAHDVRKKFDDHDTLSLTDMQIDMACQNNFYKWRTSTAICKACQTVVPHNQLFICTYSSCEFVLKQKRTIRSPEQFFGVENVVCGACAFTRVHKGHKKYVKEALPLAISSAAGELGTVLEERFNEITSPKEDHLLDYVLRRDFGIKNLPLCPIKKYMETSKTVDEFNEIAQMIAETEECIKTSRNNVAIYVKSCCGEAIGKYKKLVDTIKMKVPSVKETDSLGFGRSPEENMKCNEELIREREAYHWSVAQDKYRSTKESESSNTRNMEDFSMSSHRSDNFRRKYDLDELTYRFLRRRFRVLGQRNVQYGSLSVLSTVLSSISVPYDVKESVKSRFAEKTTLELDYYPASSTSSEFLTFSSRTSS